MQGGDSSAGFAGAILGEVRKGGTPPSEESLRRRWAFFNSLLAGKEKHMSPQLSEVSKEVLYGAVQDGVFDAGGDLR